jgi:hypothetical protein
LIWKIGHVRIESEVHAGRKPTLKARNCTIHDMVTVTQITGTVHGLQYVCKWLHGALYLAGALHYSIHDHLFTEKKNRANRDEPSRIPTVSEVSNTVPNAVSNLICT